MDERLRILKFGLNASSSNAFKSLAQYHTDTTLQISSPGSSYLNGLNSNGLKRKWCDVDGNGIENASLLLGLGRPSSSTDSSIRSSATACSMSSAKETDDGCSMDLGLDFDLSLGNENAVKIKKPVPTVSEALNVEHKVDLNLSLSVGAAESAITAIAPGSARHYYISDKLITVNQVPEVDEASISSHWKQHGNKLLKYMDNTEKASSLFPNQVTNTEAAPVGLPDFSSSVMTETLKSSFASTSKVTQPEQRSSNTKHCQFPGCAKGARGTTGLCIAHGGGRRCQRDGCFKGAEGKIIFYKAHGGGRRCQYLGCTKSAEGRTDYCIAHGGGLRCHHEGCTKAARGKSGLCIRHGGGKRCQKVDCTKSAEGHSGLCISHGGGRRCMFPKCSKGAQGGTNFCKAYGGGKRCTYLGCIKGAEGSTPFSKAHGGGKHCAFQGCMKCVHGGTHFCVAHSGGKRCTAPDCTRSARGKTEYCVRHGGGKRCKAEGCGKSAQGSTDFCKAHGGGKRCYWGQPGSGFGIGCLQCDLLARGKIGLCAAHSALVEDHQIHGGHTLVSVNMENQTLGATEKMKEVVESLEMENENTKRSSWGGFDDQNYCGHAVNPSNTKVTSLPEGRVHGGSLITMLTGNANLGAHTEGQIDGNAEHCRSHMMTRNWI